MRKDKIVWSQPGVGKAQGMRSGMFVEWSCGCKGVLAPSGEEDFIFDDCTGGGHDWRASMPRIFSTTKCSEKTYEMMEWNEVCNLLADVSDLVESGHAHRELRALLGVGGPSR